MFPPKKIFCPSDSTELEIEKVLKTQQMKETVYTYRYTKSNLNVLTTFPMSESQLRKALANKTFIPIEE